MKKVLAFLTEQLIAGQKFYFDAEGDFLISSIVIIVEVPNSPLVAFRSIEGKVASKNLTLEEGLRRVYEKPRGASGTELRNYSVVDLYYERLISRLVDHVIDAYLDDDLTHQQMVLSTLEEAKTIGLI